MKRSCANQRPWEPHASSFARDVAGLLGVHQFDVPTVQVLKLIFVQCISYLLYKLLFLNKLSSLNTVLLCCCVLVDTLGHVLRTGYQVSNSSYS